VEMFNSFNICIYTDFELKKKNKPISGDILLKNFTLTATVVLDFHYIIHYWFPKRRG